MYIITARHKGNKITRKAFSDTKAFAITNQLSREGCTEIGMKEENHTEGEEWARNEEEGRKTTYGLSDGRKHRNWAVALGHGKRRTSTPGRRTKENTSY